MGKSICLARPPTMVRIRARVVGTDRGGTRFQETIRRQKDLCDDRSDSRSLSAALALPTAALGRACPGAGVPRWRYRRARERRCLGARWSTDPFASRDPLVCSRVGALDLDGLTSARAAGPVLLLL